MECRHKFTVCRLCLCESECFIDIFRVNEWFGYVAAEVITDLLQLQVSEMDGYTHVVCTICLGKLTDFKQFKEKCQDSRDAYDNMFMSYEHPGDIAPPVFIKTEPEEGTNYVDATTEMELTPVKLEIEDPLDTQKAQEEVRKCSLAFTSLENLACRQKRTRYESYESSVNDDGGNPLPTRRKWEAVDSSPGSTKVNDEKMCKQVRNDCKSSNKKINVLPIEKSDMKRVESSVIELRRDVINQREEVNYVGTSMDASVGDEGVLELKMESNSEMEDEQIEANVREVKRKHFRCNDCGNDFESKDSLIKHLGIHGYQVNGESCIEERDSNDNCGSREERTSGYLDKGFKGNACDKVKRNKEVKIYVCDLCGKCFEKRYKWERHSRMHTCDKAFACDVCSRRFNNKSSLNKHRCTQTAEKPFECEVCGIGFKRNYELVTHRRVHSGEKPYTCETCGTKFTQSGNLTRHMRVHSEESRYKCGVCDKSYTVNANLRRHLRKHSR